MAISDLDLKRLKWFTYYVEDNDFIKYRINEYLIKAFSFPEKVRLVTSNIRPNEKWTQFSYNNLKISFTYKFVKSKSLSSRENGDIVCNGFRINNGYTIEPKLFYWELPELYIEDKHAELPLSLDRNSVYNDSIPFEKELIKQIAYNLIKSLETVEFGTLGELKYCKTKFLNYYTQVDLANFIICNKDFYTVNLPFIFRELKYQAIYTIVPNAKTAPLHNEIFNNDVPYMLSSSTTPTTWFSIQNSSENFTGNPISTLIYIDPFFSKQEEHHSKIAGNAMKDLLLEHYSKEFKEKGDNNININYLKSNECANRVFRQNFIDESNLDIPELIAVFENYYEGDYRIPYDKTKRRINTRGKL